jgi:hypothetical protein
MKESHISLCNTPRFKREGFRPACIMVGNGSSMPRHRKAMEIKPIFEETIQLPANHADNANGISGKSGPLGGGFDQAIRFSAVSPL